MSVIKTLALGIVFFFCGAPLWATNYYVNNTISGNNNSNDGLSNTANHTWTTIDRCITKPLVAGDRCNVTGGDYTARTTISISGTGSGGTTSSAITFLGSGGTRSVGFIVSASQHDIIIQGFEITNQIGAGDGLAPIQLGSSVARITIQSNNIHDTDADTYCIDEGASGSFVRIISNTISLCAEKSAIFANAYATTLPITAGSNDQVSFNVQGGSTQNITLPGGASFTDFASVAGTRTITSVTGGFMAGLVGQTITITSGTHFTPGTYSIDSFTDTHTIHVALPDPTTGGNGSAGVGTTNVNLIGVIDVVTSPAMSGATIRCGAGTCQLESLTQGPTSTITLLTPASHSAYTTLHWTTGTGVLTGDRSAAGGSTGSDTLVDGNTMTNTGSGGYQSGAGGSRIVLRNNTYVQTAPYTWHHVDSFESGGSNTQILQEGNYGLNENNSDNRGTLGLFEEDTDNHFIARFNYDHNSHGTGAFCRAECGGGSTPNTPGVYLYNNDIGVNATSLINAGATQINTQAAPNNFAKNNIWYNACCGGSPVDPYQYSTKITVANDLYWNGSVSASGKPCSIACTSAATGLVNADPLFVNVSTGDYHLQAGSPARSCNGVAGGCNLTTATSCSGSTITVADAHWFQDGWAGINPDQIAVTTVGNISTISSINYGTGVITLTGAISCSNGDSVWLYKKSDGVQVLGTAGSATAPYIGAFDQNGDSLVFTTQPSNTLSGGTISPSPVITVQLSAGGTDTGSSASITLVGDTCTVTSGGTVSAVSGVATFSSVVVTGYQACHLTASASGITSAISNSFNVTDNTAPTPGNSGTITTSGVSSSSITINWTAGTDNVTPQNQLQYEVCRSASTITTIAGCKAATIIMPYAINVVNYSDAGLTASTTYHYNVLIKDLAGNEALYTDKSQATSAPGVTTGGSAVVNAGFH